MITEKLKQVLEEQEQNQYNNKFYQKVEKIANWYKWCYCTSKWKKKVKGKATDKIRKRMKEDMQEKNKMFHNTEWYLGKETIHQKRESNTIKDIMKIILHIWNTKCNCKRNESDKTCPLCITEEDTTEQIMVCQKQNTYNLLDENENNWEKMKGTRKNNYNIQE